MDDVELSIEEEQEIYRIEEEEEDNDATYEPDEDDDSSESEQDDNNRTKSTDIQVYNNNLQKWTDLQNVISVAGIMKKSRRYTEYMTEKLISRVMWKKKKFICRQGNVWIFRVDVYFHGIIRISALTSSTQISPKAVEKRNHFHALYNKLQVGKVYIFEKLSLKHADPPLTFTIMKIDYKPITIDQLNTIREPRCKQIIGVCTYASSYDPQIGTRKITLVDDTDHEFSVTIDGENARGFPNVVDGVSNPVVLIAGLKIRISVNGRIIITILRCSHFIVNVISVRAALLVDWYFNSPHPSSFTKISRIESAPFQRYPLAMRHFLDNEMTVVTQEIVAQFKIEEKSLTEYLITRNIIPGPPVSCQWDGCSEEFGNGKFLVFDTKEELYCHLLLDHYKRDDFDCVCHWNGCEHKLATNCRWRRHLCTEIGFWPFICEVCRRAFIREHLFIEHVEKCQSLRRDGWKKLMNEIDNQQEITSHSPQIPTTFNTNSTVRYRKFLERADTGGFRYLCLEASCDKNFRNDSDYCIVHRGRNDNKWTTVAPFPLFNNQTEGKVTDSDYYYRREVLSKITGQWNNVCAYDKCFRPFNQQRPPFCSIICKNEYIRQNKSLRQIELNATADVVSGQVAASSSSNVQPPPPAENEIIVKRRLDPMSDRTKRYIRHVLWKVDQPRGQSDPDGFRRVCLVESCRNWGKSLLCQNHAASADHDFKSRRNDDQVFLMSKPRGHEWSVGDFYWTRELFDNNKRGTKNVWIPLCWNWECRSLVGNRTIGFCGLPACQEAKQLLPPIVSANAATLKRNRSKSDDRSNKKDSK